jgi:predicted RNase H-like HicB family nuclease
MSEDLHYSLVIAWSDEDQAFIVSVPELPGCRTHGATYEEALAMARDAIAGWIETQVAYGRPVPAPRSYAQLAPALAG